jgi:hypothetical protein
LSLELLETRTLLSFIAPLASDTGNTPRALAAADFNGDGIQDLVTANEGDVSQNIPGSVSVLLGNGDGTFRPGQTFQTRPPFSRPWAVVVGHFDRDSKPDFAVIDNHNQGTVSIFLGNGDGTFTPAGIYSTSAAGGTTGLAAADLRGNGITDLIVVNPSDGFNNFGSVAVLLGNGDGTFQPPQEFAAGLRPTFVTVADVNGDGKPDLVVGSSIRDTMSVLLGNGDGTFQDPQTFDVGPSPSSVAAGDFNGDGKVDLAVADGWFGGSVNVLPGNGDGTFQPGTRYRLSQAPNSVLAADLTGAGTLDLVTANGGGTVSVLPGNGDGTFQAPRSYFAGVSPFALALEDFTGDGIRDLAVVNHQSNASNVTVLVGNGDGTFQSVTSVPTASIPGPVAVGDFTGDGIPDDIAEGFFSGVSIFLGNGDGTFRAGTTVVLPDGPNSIAVGDFNGDGNLDLAVTADRSGNGSVWVLLGNGDGTFGAPVAYAAGRDAISLAVGRFRGKQSPLDLVVVNNTFPGTVQVLLGHGDGTFGPPVSYAAGPSAAAVAVGDFNGDGKDDLVVSNRSSTLHGTVTVLLGNGDGTFRPGVAFEVGVPLPGRVAVGDLRGNGILDLVVAQTLNGASTNHLVTVLLGNGDGTFGAPVSYRVGAVPVAALVGDFDRDGKADLAVANELGSTVSVLPGNGDGSFGTPVNYAVGQEPTTLAAGDFNGDGFPDLVTGDTIRTLSVLLNAADRSPRPAPSAAPGRHSSPTGGAFRGDGVAAFVRLTPATTEPDGSLVPGAAAGTARPPLRAADVERFFTALAGDERQEDAARFPPAVPQVPRGRSRGAARTDGVPGPWALPALLGEEEGGFSRTTGGAT